MRYTNAQYAQALFEALEGLKGEKRTLAIKRFFEMLQRNHATSRMGRIVEQFEKYSLKTNNMVKVEVQSASPLTDEIREQIRKGLKKDVVLDEMVDPELLAGIKMVVNNEILIDASAKRHIESMLRSR